MDDCSGEILGYTMERLLAAGALDVHYTAIYMKKNRPAWELTVLCHAQNREELERIIFAETTTIGIRRTLMQRDMLPRERGLVQTEYGEVQVKLCGGKCYVEYMAPKKSANAKLVLFFTNERGKANKTLCVYAAKVVDGNADVKAWKGNEILLSHVKKNEKIRIECDVNINRYCMMEAVYYEDKK